MADDKVVLLTELPSITILVTDDQDKHEAFEAAGIDYQGPMVLSHAEYEGICARASAAGQGVKAYLRNVIKRA